jgi:hypothetical protein
MCLRPRWQRRILARILLRMYRRGATKPVMAARVRLVSGIFAFRA